MTQCGCVAAVEAETEREGTQISGIRNVDMVANRRVNTASSQVSNLVSQASAASAQSTACRSYDHCMYVVTSIFGQLVVY